MLSGLSSSSTLLTIRTASPLKLSRCSKTERVPKSLVKADTSASKKPPSYFLSVLLLVKIAILPDSPIVLWAILWQPTVWKLIKVKIQFLLIFYQIFLPLDDAKFPNFF